MLGRTEANLENKPSVTSVESSQNCKAKTRLNWLCSEICGIFSRRIYSLHIIFSSYFSLLTWKSFTPMSSYISNGDSDDIWFKGKNPLVINFI